MEEENKYLMTEFLKSCKILKDKKEEELLKWNKNQELFTNEKEIKLIEEKIKEINSKIVSVNSKIFSQTKKRDNEKHYNKILEKILMIIPVKHNVLKSF